MPRSTTSNARRPRCRGAARGSRRGLTLLEVLLVLALLLVVTALTLPAIQRPWAAERLRRGADQVRATWLRARVAAIESGAAQAFYYQPQTGLYRVEPHIGWETDLEAVDPTWHGWAATPVPGQPRELPEEVVFLDSQVLGDSRATAAPTAAASTASPGGLAGGGMAGWAGPVLFFPDGTSSTARLLLHNEQGLFIEIALRGLTGTVTVSELLTVEETGL